MASRTSLAVALAGAFASMGATYQTANFEVEAPTIAIARQVARRAEKYRKEKALLWLGKEMPDWGRPCTVRVTLNPAGSNGVTTIFYDGQGGITDFDIEIEGRLDRLLTGVLPHEVTHAVFAQYFRCPVPPWANEGGAVLAEGESERGRYEKRARDLLDRGPSIRLRTLFRLKGYPRKIDMLYAEGYSVTRFLVRSKDRKTFLAFVAVGMRDDEWDEAVQKHYGYKDVDDLERAWLADLKGQHPQKDQARREGKGTRQAAAGP